MRCAVLAALATAWGACAAEMATTETRDVVIYGSSPAALTAAIEVCLGTAPSFAGVCPQSIPI